MPPKENARFLKHKRRFCRIEGCTRIVKSQGLCQRHGAKPRKCKIEGCEKQAQGNFDKMCKSHFKAMKRATTPLPKVDNTASPPPAQGESVYDKVLPASINFIPENPNQLMPLIAHLKAGFDGLKPPAWHRNEERRARGMFPVDNPAMQLEGWERELVWMEILVLTGAPKASFRHLARAWGRDKGFHMVLAQFICERHGDVRRKRRQGESADDDGAKRQAKKSKIVDKKNQNSVISADVWDSTFYGDVDTNEALAADIFNFTTQEFESVSSRWRSGSGENEFTSGSSSNVNNLMTHPSMTATSGENGQNPQITQTHPGMLAKMAMTSPALTQGQQVFPYQQHQIAERHQQPNLTDLQADPQPHHILPGQQMHEHALHYQQQQQHAGNSLLQTQAQYIQQPSALLQQPPQQARQGSDSQHHTLDSNIL